MTLVYEAKFKITILVFPRNDILLQISNTES